MGNEGVRGATVGRPVERKRARGILGGEMGLEMGLDDGNWEVASMANARLVDRLTTTMSVSNAKERDGQGTHRMSLGLTISRRSGCEI